MAAPLEATSEGGEGNENNVDYVKLLRESLQKQNLLYIADIVMEVGEESLANLMEYSRSDLNELLADIHNDNDNNHKIKVLHRNKFAKAVCDVATKKKEALEKQTVAPSASSTSSQVKLLFLGKEEEEAIESIQTGKQFMDENLDKMKDLFNNLDENNKNIKQNLDKICNELKQQIDAKQKQMVSSIDTFYQYYLNGLNKRNEVLQQSAKVVAKFYNDYENYFTDNKLTKSDRKDKLVAAKESIEAEVNKLKKYEDAEYKMDVVLDKESVIQCFDQCLGFSDVCVLPPVDRPEMDTDGTVMRWKSPEIKGDAINMLKNKDDDNKEEIELIFNYQILYRAMDENENEEKKEDVVWNKINNLGNVNRYDMTEYIPFEAKIKYNLNNILISPESECVSLRRIYIAKWSSEYKGDRITLSDDNTKALMAEGDDQCVRAEYPIQKGSIFKLNYTFYCPFTIYYEIVGVLSSEFAGDWRSVNTPAQTDDIQKYSYGLYCYNDNNQYYGAPKDLGWSAGAIPTGKEVTIQMVVDYKTYDTCCLSFYMDDKFIGPKDQNYSMKLPKLKNNHVWYPMTCFDYTNNWCKIECISCE